MASLCKKTLGWFFRSLNIKSPVKEAEKTQKRQGNSQEEKDQGNKNTKEKEGQGIGTNTPQICTPSLGTTAFDPTQTGLCKFGRGLGARWHSWPYANFSHEHFRVEIAGVFLCSSPPPTPNAGDLMCGHAPEGRLSTQRFLNLQAANTLFRRTSRGSSRPPYNERQRERGERSSVNILWYSAKIICSFSVIFFLSCC